MKFRLLLTIGKKAPLSLPVAGVIAAFAGIEQRGRGHALVAEGDECHIHIPVVTMDKTLISRRQLLLSIGAAVVTQASEPSLAQSGVWPSADPVDAGFAPDLGARLDKAFSERRIWNVHGLVVLRNDRLVLERYFEGEDRARGIGAIGRVAFTPDTFHDLRSCSKSIIGLLYGVALQQGKVPAPEAPLFPAFPEYADLADKEGRDRLIIQHVLTMTMGTDWDECYRRRNSA